jgi:hypothetical protein
MTHITPENQNLVKKEKNKKAYNDLKEKLQNISSGGQIIIGTALARDSEKYIIPAEDKVVEMFSSTVISIIQDIAQKYNMNFYISIDKSILTAHIYSYKN